MPAPSPTTKPSRSLSKGRQAWVGSSLRVERAFMAAKPPTPMGVMAASAPPAIIAVGVAALDDAEGVADGVRGGGAGGGGRLVRALGAVADGDVSGGEVDDGGGDEERRDLARPAVHQVGVLALDDVEAADAGADVHADVVCDLRRDLQAGVLHRLVCGCEGEVDEAAHFAGLFLIHELVGVEVFHFGGKPHGMAGEVEGLNLGHAAAAGHQAFPHFGGGVADPAERRRGR